MDANDTKKVINTAKEKMQKAVSYLENELSTYRIGKANPAVFASVLVDYYGQQTPIPNAASITSPDAKTILIQPWDKKMIGVIEKAILAANIGFTPQNNGEVIRITVPPLTEERRKELVKKAKAECENTKVTVRNARRDGVDALKKMQKEGLSEDIEKDEEAKLTKETDTFVKKIDEIFTAKEKEIMKV